MIAVNYMAVGVSAVASMGVGYVWYSPMLFGNRWMKLTGVDPKNIDKSGMGMKYGTMFVVSLLMAYILAMFIHYAGAYSLVNGIKTGLWAWLGFVLPTTLANQLFSKKPMELYYLEAGHHLVNLLVMGAILGLWF